MAPIANADVERQRLLKDSTQPVPPWRRWGPYLSERSWATVREDYSADGNAWAYFPHDLARSKAYRWGEDGLAGFSDRYQVLNFCLGLWNEKDPILKERLFGLTSAEGNHGEDVKECYYYLDATPSHSYLKHLYKYPQRAFPYQELIEGNQKRGSEDPELELADLGAFDDDRYFDVFTEFAKADPEDLFIRVTVCNRGPDDAPVHVLPQLWFRNTWSWGETQKSQPEIVAGPPSKGTKSAKVACLVADDAQLDPLGGLSFEYKLGPRYFYGPDGAELLFTNNETNAQRVYGAADSARGNHFKDAFHAHVVNGHDSCSPQEKGTKAALHYTLSVPANSQVVLKFRLSPKPLENPLADLDAVLEQRKREADDFYQSIHPAGASDEEKRVQRQAFAGMIWGKQTYLFNVHQWLEGDNGQLPPPESRLKVRNTHWRHLNSMRVLSLPDKWEYPWFAAWDLAFHTVPLAVIDAEFAKQQLWLMLFEQFQHPNGQIPAYEWEFSDLNPPVHAWAVWRVYNMDRIRNGKADRLFLERCFHKLLINFSWWVNKVDSDGNNVFEGGFLGLDNITVIDRSEKLAPGTTLKQADATGWMGMFCLNLMRIALELAKENKAYESLASKFFEHFVYIGAAMKNMGGKGWDLWDEADGFFYDVLREPSGHHSQFRLRSLVGLIPLFAIERLEEDWLEPFPEFRANFHWFLKNRKALAAQCVHTLTVEGKTVHVLSIMSTEQIRRALVRVADPNEFASDFGLRSLSKAHAEKPFTYGNARVAYEPGESPSKLKGGNSNWRGPIWFPTTFMMIEALRKLVKAYGPEYLIVDPDTGRETPLVDMAEVLAGGLIRLFVPDKSGRRPAHGDDSRYASDPHWKDLVLFYEYFHGDTGRGLGASHQTGWTGLVASVIDEWR
ncbi:MAG: hypothetical protein WCG80_06450 [Spirochaetales bacterium]